MSVFKARYAGKCSKCSQPVAVGQYITWQRGRKGVVYHANCDQPDAVPETPTAKTPMEAIEAAVDASNYVVEHTQPEKPSGNGHSDMAATMAQFLAPYIKATLNPEQVESIARQVVNENSFDKEAIEKMVREAANKIPKPITVKVESAPDKVKDVENPHKLFTLLLYLVGKRHHVYLHGAPGSGKSTATRMAAESLDWQYGYISLNPQTPESRLIGYLDANGNYRETVFAKLYREGGIFCIDELDNAAPALLTTLNSCLENGHAAFPNGMVKRHDNFVVVATGNTCGHGANYLFPERRPFDAAFSERFTFLAWEYDENMETIAAQAINNSSKANSWIRWVQKIRTIAATKKLRVVISPRASLKGVEYLKDDVLKPQDIADMLIWKGCEESTKTQLLGEAPIPR